MSLRSRVKLIVTGLSILNIFRNSVRGFADGFVWKMTLCNTAAYLIVTVPPIFIDPLLKHHVRYPARSYEHTWLIFPLGIATFYFSAFLMRRGKKVWRVVLPFIILAGVSLFIYRPELPHGYVTGSSLLWLAVAIVTAWFHVRAIEYNIIEPEIDKTALIEYLKEETLFWRTMLVLLAGSYFALIISWANFIQGFNRAIVGGNPSETFILNNLSLTGIILFTVAIIIGPLAEAAAKHSQAKKLFLAIKDTSKQEA